MAATVLVSGGLDSTVLLHYVAGKLGVEDIYALSFDYGQRHSRELDMARWQCDCLPQVKEHKILKLDFFADLMGGATALVKGGSEVPDLTDLADEERDQPPTYVPNRNMVLLSLAASFAESRGCGRVFYGAQAQDEYGYWDCTNDFVDYLNQVFSLNRRTPVVIEAPFARKRKSEEVVLGLELGVDFAHTWSCYRGGEKPCLACPTCVERITAFKEAGAEDPLV